MNKRGRETALANFLKLEFDTYVLNEKMIPIWKSIAAHASLVSAYDAGMVG